MTDDLAKGRLHARKIIEPELNRTLYLVKLANQPGRRMDDEMGKLVLAILAKAVAEKRWPGESLMGSP